MNLLNGGIQCIECKSKKLIKDLEHQEVYCSKCGLVLIDSSMLTLQEQENQIKGKIKKQTRIQYNKLKNYLYHFH